MKTITVTEEEKLKIQDAELLILGELDRICQKYQIKYIIAYGTLIGAIRHEGFIPWDDDVDVCMLRPDFNRFKEVCKTELGNDFFYQDNDTDPEYYYLIDKIRLNGTVFRENFVSKYNIHHGIYIDIFPVDFIPNNKLLMNIQYYQFHFFRTGLMAKYLDLKARTGKKRILMSMLGVLYRPFNLNFLYRNAIKVATKYNDLESAKVCSFFSPYKKRDIFEKNIFETVIRHIFEKIEVNIPKKYDVYLSKLYGQYMELPPISERITRHSITKLEL